eukprot:jgi/Bigna1/71986/fgenesh1_pg.18_\
MHGSGNATCPLCRAQIPHNWRAGQEMKEIKRGEVIIAVSVGEGDSITHNDLLPCSRDYKKGFLISVEVGVLGSLQMQQHTFVVEEEEEVHESSKYKHNMVGLTNRNQYGYNGLNNGGDDWLYYYWLTQPRIASYDGIGVVNNLPNVSNAIETAMTMSRSIQAALASSSSSGGGGGGSSFGGGGGFSGGGGAGGGW